jgi:hypothetical protein
MATDLSIQRNFKKDQRYWAVGQTVHAQFHLAPKEGIYMWFSYYSNGKFSNHLVASAKLPSTLPQYVIYTNSAKMRVKQFSVGYKRYLIGNSQKETALNLYFYGGFGLELGRVINVHSTAIDTSQYNLPVLSGQANFKRLTLDAGLGIDRYLLADLYVYAEARAWIPTTDYPSHYIFANTDAPWLAMINIGLRVLF